MCFPGCLQNTNESLYDSSNHIEISKELLMHLPYPNRVGIFLHQHSGNVFKDYNDLLYDHKNSANFPTGTCTPFEQKIFITVNGKILPCERIGHQHALGEVSNDKVEIDFKYILDTYRDYFNKVKTMCNTCYNFSNCPICIFDLDLENPNPRCK